MNPLSLADLVEEVQRIEIESQQWVNGALAGSYRSVFRGTGMEFDEVREYVAGDDPRSVDWKVTARVGRPYVKRFVDERDLAVLFVVDLSSSMDAGLGVWSARQMAARICACLGLAAVKNNDRVGLVAFHQQVERSIPPARGFRHVLRIVRDCLAHPPGQGPADLGVGIDFVARAVRRRSIVFVVSDFLGGGWSQALGRAARHHDVIAVRLESPEWQPPRRGLWMLRDPEFGQQQCVDWRHRATRRHFQAQMQAWQGRSDQLLRRAHVDLMRVPIPLTWTSDAVVRPILKFFRMRELRGGRR